MTRAERGFKVNVGEAKYGEHFYMKGVILNNFDIKVSGADTENNLGVFEQTGLTPNGGPHLHTYQYEWFYVIKG